MPAEIGDVEGKETKHNSTRSCGLTENLKNNENISRPCTPNPLINEKPTSYCSCCKISLNEVNPSCDKSNSSNDWKSGRDTPEVIGSHLEMFDCQYIKKSPGEIKAYSVEELKLLVKKLSKAVEEISSQLVQLLVENDALQQESDARNVAIEQLLRITVKETENDLRPIQMSVILSTKEYET